MFGTSSLLALAAAVAPTMAATFYTLDLRTPGYVNIINFSGTMQTPSEFPTGYPGSGGTYYLWPGLQGSNTPGVLQSMLGPNQNANSWYEGTGYCCVDGIPWGGGVSLSNGEKFYWNYQINSDGTWTYETGHPGQSAGATNTFQLQAHALNLAVWAIELYSPTAWNFGQVPFYDVSVPWLGSDTSACSDGSVSAYNGDFTSSVEVASATLNNNDGTTTCYLSQIVLESPNS